MTTNSAFRVDAEPEPDFVVGSVIYAGALDMQVCVPAEWDDARARAFAEHRNPCGTEHGWQIRREGSDMLAGCPERAVCAARDGFVHIMLDA
jgi:hypothetical protein